MARAKCQYDKKQVDTNTAFKIVQNGKNLYWCSEECYNLQKQRDAQMAATKAEYDEIFEITKQIFGYDFCGYSLLKREITAWERLTTRQNIISYLKENRDWLSRTMSKEFQSDYNRVRYYSAVISSKLHDYKPKVNTNFQQQTKVKNSFELYEPTIQTYEKIEPQVLFDVEDDLL